MPLDCGLWTGLVSGSKPISRAKRRVRCSQATALRAGSGKLDSADKWSFCLKAA